MPTPKHVLICSVDSLENGEWSELAEFLIGTKEEIDKEFVNAINDEDYPVVIKAVITEMATK